MSDTAARTDPAPEPEDATAAILDTVRNFRPGAVVTRVATRTRPVPYRAVPNLDRPRLLIPGAPRRAAAQAMLRFSSALTAKEAIARIGAAAVIRLLGPGVVFPDGVVVSNGPDPGLAGHLADQLGEPVTYGLGIGTARANRKPILAVFDRRGRNIAFAKIGDNPVASERVLAEAAALREVDGRLGTGFEVPRIISLSRWAAHDVLLLSALATTPQNPRRFWEIPVERMDEFSRAFDSGRAPLAEIPGWQRMRSAVMPSRPVVDRWTELAVRLEESAQDGPELPVGAWHGDWTAWNMARRHGRLQLWDFERFERGSARGLDLFHFPVNATILREGLSAGNVTRGLRMALSATEDDRPNRIVAAFYLVAIAFRYLESLGQDGEHLVSERLSVMLTALDTWLSDMVV